MAKMLGWLRPDPEDTGVSTADELLPLADEALYPALAQHGFGAGRVNVAGPGFVGYEGHGLVIWAQHESRERLTHVFVGAPDPQTGLLCFCTVLGISKVRAPAVTVPIRSRTRAEIRRSLAGQGELLAGHAADVLGGDLSLLSELRSMGHMFPFAAV